MKSKSIARKMALAFIVSVVLQSMVMWAVLAAGGVVRHSKANACEIFSEKVSSRSDNLENEMNAVWTNFGLYTNQIQKYFSSGEAEGKAGVDQILEEVAPVVLNAMNYTKTTGAFLVLDEVKPGTDEHAAVYIQNANPDRTDEKNASTYLLYGPWNVAERLNIVTDANWSYRMDLSAIPKDFYQKPFENRDLTDQEALLGYWSRPFKPTPNSEEVIAYSVPLSDKKGNPIGVFGVEISVNYLYKRLPASELKAPDSYGYIIATRDEPGAPLRASVIHGAVQKRVFKEGQELDLRPVNEDYAVYSVGGKAGGPEICASLHRMGMYYNNTPFSGEEWFLVGLLERSALFAYPQKIEAIIATSFCISLLLGVLLALTISRWFTKYSRLMELSEVPVGVFEINGHRDRVLMTMQVPQLLGLSRSQERKFAGDKAAFCEFLRMLGRQSSEEDGTVRLFAGGRDTWIRLSCKERDGTFIGVIEDVTGEHMAKRRLEQERDYDGLTGVKNRMAFERESEKYDENLDKEAPLCAVMCDLNGLKQANDRFGHNVGDEYIRFCADAICRAFPMGTVYRIGGDEFVVITERSGPEEVEMGVQTLREEMKRYDAKQAFRAGIAAGYAFYDAGLDRNLGDVLSRADQRMYVDKARWKG